MKNRSGNTRVQNMSRARVDVTSEGACIIACVNCGEILLARSTTLKQRSGDTCFFSESLDAHVRYTSDDSDDSRYKCKQIRVLKLRSQPFPNGVFAERLVI